MGCATGNLCVTDAVRFVVLWNLALVNLLQQGCLCLDVMFIHIYMSQYDVKVVIVNQKNLSGNYF